MALFLAVQCIAIVMLVKLKNSSIEKYTIQQNSFFELYNFSKIFDVSFPLPIPKMPEIITKTVTEEVMRNDPYRVSAMFIGNEKSFIMLEDGQKTELINKNGSYKHYKLIDIIGKKAVFEAYGQKYELTAGTAGTLPRKELITKTITEIKGQPEQKVAAQAPKEYLGIQRTELNDYVSNMNMIWTNIAIDEVIENGKITGFTVKSVNNSSVFAKLGIQSGDKLIAVNNRKLNSYADAMYFYKNIDKFRSLKITLTRNNSTKDLEYEIRN